MRKALKILLILPLAIIGGCGRQKVSPCPPIPYVDSVVVSTHIHEHGILSSLTGTPQDGDIAIFDTPERCLLLSESFMTADFADNVDGSPVCDWLPDFAGERIAAIIDDRYIPYSRYLGGKETSLREIAVRGFISAMDTVCAMAAFDAASRSRKPRAKAIVLSSAFMAAYGRYDIDTLMRSFKMDIPVFSPVNSMIAEAVDTKSNPSDILVLASADVISSGAYQKVFREMMAQRGDTLSRCFLVPAPAAQADSNGICLQTDFRAALDSCRIHNITHVSSMLVDDYTIPVEELNGILDDILSSDDEADVLRRQVVAKDFSIIDPRRSVVTDCYRTFRRKNLFTHNIAYPVASAYITSPESESFMLMDFDESLLPDTLHDFMSDMAPKTHKSYVQNQHFTGGN